MNTHKNARLTFSRRLEMVMDITQHRLSRIDAAQAQGVSLATVSKWLGRYLAQGEAGLQDRSSRPALSLRSIAPGKALAIVELRRQRQGGAIDPVGPAGMGLRLRLPELTAAR